MNASSSANTYKSLIGFDNRPIRVKQFIVQKAVSERIAAVLRSGMIPWKNDVINDKNNGLPHCAATQETYSPINTVLLQMASRKQGFVSRWWDTQSNWKEFGGVIDESAEPTLLFDAAWTLAEAYCADQVTSSRIEDLRVNDQSIVLSEDADYSRINLLVEQSGADIRIGVGDQRHSASGDWYIAPNPYVAFPFHRFGDYILLQRPERRSSIASHYYTLLHEFVHWSEVRTNWIDDLHAREFVSEVASGWLSSELGCPPCQCRINHDRWVERWLWEMRDETYLFRVLDQAWKSFQFIMSIIEGEQRC